MELLKFERERHSVIVKLAGKGLIEGPEELAIAVRLAVGFLALVEEIDTKRSRMLVRIVNNKCLHSR